MSGQPCGRRAGTHDSADHRLKLCTAPIKCSMPVLDRLQAWTALALVGRTGHPPRAELDPPGRVALLTYPSPHAVPRPSLSGRCPLPALIWASSVWGERCGVARQRRRRHG